MNKFIGKPLEKVYDMLKSKGKHIILANNNHNVSGDTRLVTNVTEIEDKIIITYGEFIFNLKGMYDK